MGSWAGESGRVLWLTLTILIITSLEGSSSASSSPVGGRGLSVSVWRVFPDTAVFDWYITLAEKHKMVSCNLTYGPKTERNKSTIITNFLPKHRSFSLLNLEQNTSYKFLMVCRDREDRKCSSEKLTFDTGVVITPEGDPKLGAIFSPRKHVLESANLDIRSKYIMGRYKQRDPKSPHTLMGVSCAVVGLVITSLTVGLVARRYSNANSIKMPKSEECQVKANDTRLPSSSLTEGCYSNSLTSLSPTSSLSNIQQYVDSNYSGPVYSFTEGEAEEQEQQKI